MTVDYILEISYGTERHDLDDRVEASLYVTKSLGESFVEAGGRRTRSVYFGSVDAREYARELLADLAGEVELREVDAARVDWLEKYEQSLSAIEIGERFVVAPDR